MIVPTLAKILIQEHLYRPIRGKVLCLGRQTIAMTHKEAVALIRKEGVDIPESVVKETALLEDKSTRYGKGKGRISDTAFFKLLGITDVVSMDVSDYENAEIVHCLNKPVPKALHGKFDFIIDGGTFDHLFDVRAAFINVAKMLKEKGRVFQWNAASNYTGGAYISFGPDLFYDYFILNQFADCRVWIAEGKTASQAKNWNLYEFEGAEQISDIRSRHYIMTIVLAERGPNTTWNKIPTQAHYRDQDLWGLYKKGKKNILNSQRKPLQGYKKYYYLGPQLSTILRRITDNEFIFHKGYRFVGLV